MSSAFVLYSNWKIHCHLPLFYTTTGRHIVICLCSIQQLEDTLSSAFVLYSNWKYIVICLRSIQQVEDTLSTAFVVWAYDDFISLYWAQWESRTKHCNKEILVISRVLKFHPDIMFYKKQNNNNKIQISRLLICRLCAKWMMNQILPGRLWAMNWDQTKENLLSYSTQCYYA